MVGGIEPEEGLRLARLANDGLAKIVQRTHTGFSE